MIPPLSPEVRFIIHFLVNLASIIGVGIFLDYASPYVNYWLQKHLPGTKRKALPTLKPPTAVWVIFGVSVFVVVFGTAWVETAPEPVIKIPYMASNSLINFLAVLGLLIAGVAGYVAFSHKHRHGWRFSLTVRIWAYGILATGMILLLGSVNVIYHQQRELREKFIILITDLDREGAQEYGITDTLIAQLRDDLQGFDEILVMTLPITISEGQGSLYAVNIGNKEHADLVLWGYYNANDMNARLTIHIENPTQLQILSSVQEGEYIQLQGSIGELQSFSLQQKAANELKALSALVTGVALYDSGDYSAALDRFEFALAQPDWAENLINRGVAYFLKGSVNYFLGFYDQALTDFTAALQINPQDALAYNNNCVVYISLGEYQQAISNCTAALQLEPHDASIYLNRGVAYLAQGNYVQAIDDFNTTLQIDPQHHTVYVSRAIAHGMIGELDKALQDFTAALKFFPDQTGIYTNRAYIYKNYGDYEQAITDYDTALKIDPYYTVAYDGRGNIYCLLGQYARGIEDYNTALQIDPRYITAYNNRGTAYLRLEQYNLAITDFTTSIQINPRDSGVYSHRCLAYFNSGDYENALEDCNTAISLNPNNTHAYLWRGNTYYEISNYDQAISDYTSLLQINPLHQSAYIHRAQAYGKLGDYEQAILDYTTSLQITPQSANVYYERGDAYLKLGQYDQAIMDFNATLKISPNAAQPYCGLGHAYQNQGMYLQAENNFRSCLELSKSPTIWIEAQEALQSLP